MKKETLFGMRKRKPLTIEVIHLGTLTGYSRVGGVKVVSLVDGCLLFDCCGCVTFNDTVASERLHVDTDT
jgi:hypothetical protein